MLTSVCRKRSLPWDLQVAQLNLRSVPSSRAVPGILGRSPVCYSQREGTVGS